MIFQYDATPERPSSFLPHIINNVISLIADLWQMTPF
jgi:hypothetical protein